jgi:hypothetical protein
MGKITHADTIPYETPDSLDDLSGPVSGVVRVPMNIHPGPDPTYDTAEPKELTVMYADTIRDGLKRQQEQLLDKQLLLRLWPDLPLPTRCRAIWETHFPELSELRAA